MKRYVYVRKSMQCTIILRDTLDCNQVNIFSTRRCESAERSDGNQIPFFGNNAGRHSG